MRVPGPAWQTPHAKAAPAGAQDRATSGRSCQTQQLPQLLARPRAALERLLPAPGRPLQEVRQQRSMHQKCCAACCPLHMRRRPSCMPIC